MRMSNDSGANLLDVQARPQILGPSGKSTLKITILVGVLAVSSRSAHLFCRYQRGWTMISGEGIGSWLEPQNGRRVHVGACVI